MTEERGRQASGGFQGAAPQASTGYFIRMRSRNSTASTRSSEVSPLRFRVFRKFGIRALVHLEIGVGPVGMPKMPADVTADDHDNKRHQNCG